MRTKRNATAEGVEASQDPKKLSSSLGLRRKLYLADLSRSYETN